MTDTPTTLVARVARARAALAEAEKPRCKRSTLTDGGWCPCDRPRDHAGACDPFAVRLAHRHARALSDALAEVEGERDRLRAGRRADFEAGARAMQEHIVDRLLGRRATDEMALAAEACAIANIDPAALGHGGGGQ